MTQGTPPPFSIDRYADILGEGVGLPAPDWAAIAARHGLDRATWERGMAEWGARLAEGGEGAALNRDFTARLTAALARSIGEHAPVSLDAYVDISARAMTGEPIDRALADHGLDMRRFTLAGYQWKARGEEDPRLGVYLALRTKKGIVERTHEAERSQFAVYGPGNLVRARRCRACGALKAVKPTTAYIYCDYCATLFDYDSLIEFRDDASLGSDDVDRALVAVVQDELTEAFRRGDRAAYARTYSWIVEVLTEICPLAYSPRIKDEEYRARFIHDLIVPWTVLTQFDERSRADSAKFATARDRAIRNPKLGSILELFGVARQAWEYEVELFEREGLFARHPDRYDPALYIHVNASIFARPWLAVLDDADQKRLLAATGVASEYVPAPEVSFSSCGCGQCGAELQVPAGSTRMVCVACGHVLELGARTFGCRNCGRPLSMPARGTDVVCGSCNARWVR
jgi:hypothetical protein